MKFIKKLSKKNLLTTSIFYTGINFFNKVFPFVLLPVLTRNLSMSDYGEYTLFKAAGSFFLPLISLNVSELIMKQFFNTNKTQLGNYITNSIYINILLTGVFIILISTIHINILSKEILFFCVVIAFFTSLNNIERNILRAENNIKLYGILVIGQTLLFFCIIMYYLYKKDINLINVIYIESISCVIFGIFSLFILAKKCNLNFRINKLIIKSILNFSFPLALNSLLAYTFVLSDRFIISHKLSNSDLAIYSASFQLVSILQVLAISFNMGWTPYVYKNLSKSDNSLSILKLQKKIALYFLIICIIFYLIIYELFVLIVGDNYVEGKELLIWFTIGVFFQLVYWLNSSILIYKKHNWYLTLCTLISMILSILLNILFINKYGLVFSSQMYTLSWFILSILIYHKVSKELNNNINN